MFILDYATDLYDAPSEEDFRALNRIYKRLILRRGSGVRFLLTNWPGLLRTVICDDGRQGLMVAGIPVCAK